MSRVTHSWHYLAAAALAAMSTFAACAPAGLDAEAEDVGEQAEGVSGSLAVGTKLVATGNVNLRASATTGSSVLRVVPNGGEVVVKKSAPSNGFYQVTYDGTTGWTSGKYYTVAAPPDADDPVADGMTLIATANVNLRSGPSTSSTILDIVEKGSEVTLLSDTKQNGYYQVKFQGTSGWSHGNYYEKPGSGSTSGGGDDGQPWTCTGSYATTKVSGGKYYSTSFGCWVDDNGNAHGDSGDNCIPFCHSAAKADGLCAGMSGPECERNTNWYAADAGRFGCMTRLRVTSVASGKSAVVVVLDAGPACWVENKVKAGVLDLSSRVTDYLFDGQVGLADKAMVQVEEVPSSTALGPD